MGARKREALEQFNRDNIVSAARELFDTKGIDKTTMDDIARHADYSKSTIYVYFRSKEDIYNAIVQEHIEVLTGSIEAYMQQEYSFEKNYYMLCRSLVDFQKKYPKYYSSIMGETAITNSRKQKNQKHTLGMELGNVIYSILQRGRESNVISADIDLWPTVFYVWSALSGIIQVAQRREDMLSRSIDMEPDEYLEYSFERIYESLLGRSFKDELQKGS